MTNPDWINVMVNRCLRGETMSKATFRARIEALDNKRGINPPNWRVELEATRPKKTKGARQRSVYFVQSGKDGPIKIGVTSNVKARVSALQTAHPRALTLRLVVPGTCATEQLFHQRFAAFRMSGEWFRADPALLKFIDSEGAE